MLLLNKQTSPEESDDKKCHCLGKNFSGLISLGTSPNVTEQSGVCFFTLCFSVGGDLSIVITVGRMTCSRYLSPDTFHTNPHQNVVRFRLKTTTAGPKTVYMFVMQPLDLDTIRVCWLSVRFFDKFMMSFFYLMR